MSTFDAVIAQISRELNSYENFTMAIVSYLMNNTALESSLNQQIDQKLTCV